MAHVTIDYDSLWMEQMKVFDHGSDAAEYWNRRSWTYESPWRTSTYAIDLVNRMDLTPDDSVLDIACGSGVTVIPLALRVHHITALDISLSMLENLKIKAAESGINNITIINSDWNTIVIGKDIGIHDIVLVSRSLPGIKLSEALGKINEAAKSACYITWRAERIDDYETAIARILGKKYPLYPDYNIIIKTLKNMGITANVQMFDSTNKEQFPSLESAVTNMAKGVQLNDRQHSGLYEVAKSRLTQVGGFYCSTYAMKWALISWRLPVE
jgi:SAM-dependent methyltransferase